MSSFTAPLRVVILEGEWNGRGLVQLLEPLVYYVGYLNSDDYIVVPAGFISDLVSVPPIARGLIAPLDRAAKAGVVHDWLLYEGKRGKVESAKIFLEALGVLKVPVWKRYIMYWVVRYYPWTKEVIQDESNQSSRTA